MADLSSLKDLGTSSEAAAPVHVRKVELAWPLLCDRQA